MSESEERLNVILPAELKERLRSGDDSMKSQIVEALEIYFGQGETSSRAAIERQIQRYEEKRARGRQMIQDGEDMVSEAEDALEALHQRLDEMERKDETYEQALDEQIEDMCEGSYSIWEAHPTVERISRDHGKPASVVIDDLKARSDLNDSRFEEQLGQPDDSDLDLDDEVDLDYDWGEN